MRNEPGRWSLACHLDYGDSGAVAIIEHVGGRTTVYRVPSAPATGRPAGYRPVYLGVTADRRAVLLDPESKVVSAAAELPLDAVALYAYPELGTRRFWYTNDGDEETGNDVLNCGDTGASMTVIEAQADGLPKFVKTICVGRGHHVPSFTAPDARHPGVKRRAYVSNLQDGTIAVVGNDPGDKSGYLAVLGSINLCEPAKEKDGGDMQVPNNAFPHGQAYSPTTGRLYGLNNGYGTVAVIDPASNRIESRIDFKVSSNLLLSPDGRFLIGKGADRKRDAEHVMGRLTVMDAVEGRVVATDIQDVYPSTYRFSADGRRLYVTTAATGKGAQKTHLAIDTVLVYDATALPEIRLLRTVGVGKADCGRRPVAFLVDQGRSRLVFVPNPTDGTLSILDGEADDRLIETVTVSDRPIEELNFSLLGADNLYGC